MTIRQALRQWCTIVAGIAIVAAAVYFFMLPSDLSVGSASALAQVLSHFIPLPMSVITFILNAGLLILGFVLVGPEFSGRTVVTSLLLPVFLGLYEILFPDFVSFTQDAALDLVCYMLVVSIGIAMLFSCNASSGGLDIVAKLMNKYLHMELGKAMSLSGMLVALSSALVYDKKSVVLSVLGTYFCGMIVDHFIFGMNIKRRVCILSDKMDDILQFILHDLHSGATLYESIGAYGNTRRTEIVTIVDKQEYRLLMDYLKRTDPAAFITVYSVSEIHYTPKA